MWIFLHYLSFLQNQAIAFFTTEAVYSAMSTVCNREGEQEVAMSPENKKGEERAFYDQS